MPIGRRRLILRGRAARAPRGAERRRLPRPPPGLGLRGLGLAKLALILERCKGVHCVDLGESFQTHIYLQNLASIQPRTSPNKFVSLSDAEVEPQRRPAQPLLLLALVGLKKEQSRAAHRESATACMPPDSSLRSRTLRNPSTAMRKKTKNCIDIVDSLASPFKSTSLRQNAHF